MSHGALSEMYYEDKTSVLREFKKLFIQISPQFFFLSLN